jgi:redox-sensitive bicupin YhaK (pirin superfamily)
MKKNGQRMVVPFKWSNFGLTFRLNTKKLHQNLVQIPRVHLAGGEVEEVAGEYEGKKGAASTFSPMHVYNITLKEGGEIPLEPPSHFNTAFIVIDGEVLVNGKTSVQKDQFVLMENKADDNFTLKGLEQHSKVLLLSGNPLKEPVAPLS